MSAAVLREAATKMRERAEAAPPSAWGVDEVGAVWVDHDEDGLSASCLVERFPIWAEGSGEHIASWHPAVALAVADWLEGVAAWDDEGLGWVDPIGLTNWPSMWGDMQVSALAVARAYLGADS